MNCLQRCDSSCLCTSNARVLVIAIRWCTCKNEKFELPTIDSDTTFTVNAIPHCTRSCAHHPPRELHYKRAIMESSHPRKACHKPNQHRSGSPTQHSPTNLHLTTLTTNNALLKPHRAVANTAHSAIQGHATTTTARATRHSARTVLQSGRVWAARLVRGRRPAGTPNTLTADAEPAGTAPFKPPVHCG